MKPLAFRFSKLALGEVRQFEIVEEQVEKFIAAQNEPECIFTVAFTRLGRSSATFARTRKYVAFNEFLVSWKHHVARTDVAAEAWFVHPVEWDVDLAAFQDIPDVAVLRGFFDGALNQRLGTAQKPLAVFKAFTARVQTPVNDVHSPSCIRLNRLVSPACTIRRAGEPDARYGRAPPSARQTRHVSFRYRRPFLNQTR